MWEENILNEIRKMANAFYEKFRIHGDVVCLDANAEVRFVAYVMYKLCSDKKYLVPNEVQDYCSRNGIATQSATDELLENGIRNFNIRLYGMRLKFDCKSFCIDGDKTNRWSTQAHMS